MAAQDNIQLDAETARRMALARAYIVESAASIAANCGLTRMMVHALIIEESHKALVSIDGEDSTVDLLEKFVGWIRCFSRLTPSPTRH